MNLQDRVLYQKLTARWCWKLGFELGIDSNLYLAEGCSGVFRRCPHDLSARSFGPFNEFMSGAGYALVAYHHVLGYVSLESVQQ